MSEIEFVVVIPAKPLSRAKTRLVGLPDDQRRALAKAFLLDTVTAASAAESVTAVLVVTDDFRLAAELPTACAVIPDGVSDDLNTTLRLAAAEAHRRWPTARPVALCADLPSLTSAALDEVLTRIEADAAQAAAFVADRDGTGTTLYSAPSEAFRPRFGADSALRHRDAGALEMAAHEVVRQDVDTLADLTRATLLGLGHHAARAFGRA